jgi:hypothetical protein
MFDEPSPTTGNASPLDGIGRVSMVSCANSVVGIEVAAATAALCARNWRLEDDFRIGIDCPRVGDVLG